MIFSDQTLRFLLPGPRIWMTLVTLRSNSLSKAKGKIPYTQTISSVCNRWNALLLHHALSPRIPPPIQQKQRVLFLSCPPRNWGTVHWITSWNLQVKWQCPTPQDLIPALLKRNCMPRAKKDPGLKMNRYDWWLIYKGRCSYAEHVWRLSTAVVFHICPVTWQFLTPEAHSLTIKRLKTHTPYSH